MGLQIRVSTVQFGPPPGTTSKAASDKGLRAYSLF